MRKFFGGLLIAIGVLIAGVSGLCSAAMLSTPSGPEVKIDLAMVAVFGGVPFVFGLMVLFTGVVLYRAK
jgi:hypothetical protein